MSGSCYTTQQSNSGDVKEDRGSRGWKCKDDREMKDKRREDSKGNENNNGGKDDMVSAVVVTVVRRSWWLGKSWWSMLMLTSHYSLQLWVLSMQ